MSTREMGRPVQAFSYFMGTVLTCARFCLPFDVFELLFDVIAAELIRAHGASKSRHPIIWDIPKIVRHFCK